MEEVIGTVQKREEADILYRVAVQADERGGFAQTPEPQNDIYELKPAHGAHPAPD